MDEVRETSRARAPDSTLPGERRSVNGPTRRRRLRSQPPGPRRGAQGIERQVINSRGLLSNGRDSRFGLARPVLWVRRRGSSVPAHPERHVFGVGVPNVAIFERNVASDGVNEANLLRRRDFRVHGGGKSDRERHTSRGVIAAGHEQLHH